MKVTPYGTSPFRTSQVRTGEATSREVQSSGSGTASEFARGLGRALDELSKVQDQADAMVTKLVTGQAEDIHSVILAVERANLSLQMAVQVRNKVLEAYQEIMHMQV